MNKKIFGAFFDPFFDFLKIRKISNIQQQKAPKNFQNDFLAMGGGAKIPKKDKNSATEKHSTQKTQKKKI